MAAACYAVPDVFSQGYWPPTWDFSWYKPTTRIRDLVKAGALIAAEIDRHQRIEIKKAKEEYIAYLLNNDVHDPAKLRANIPPRNFPEWYETFGVTEKDEMYIAPEKRIVIW